MTRTGQEDEKNEEFKYTSNKLIENSLGEVFGILST